jgi:hypothetical protein
MSDRAMERVAIVFLVIVALLVVAACDEPKCKDGEQTIQGADVFLCVDGRWERQDNPYRDPIEAFREQGLVGR